MKLIPKIGKGLRNIGDYVHSFSPGAYAHKRSMEGWREQTKYNTPENQVGRLRKAGLNPALMYGNGTAATGNAGPAPQQNPSEDSGLLGVLGKFVEGIKAMSETRRAKAQAEGQEVENIFQKWYKLGQGNLGSWTKEKGYQGSAAAVEKIANVNLTEWKKHLTDKQITQVQSTIEKINQDTRWQKFENEFREKYGLNMSEGWKIKLAVSILKMLGGQITDQQILDFIK